MCFQMAAADPTVPAAAVKLCTSCFVFYIKGPGKRLVQWQALSPFSCCMFPAGCLVTCKHWVCIALHGLHLIAV